MTPKTNNSNLSKLKERQQELVSALQARGDTVEVDNMVELIGLLLESTKRNLVTCDASMFQCLQGEAQGYDRILRMLQRAPLPSGAKEE